MANEELEQKLSADIERELPAFAEACRSKEDNLIFHQDAFAADLDLPELLLLGKAVKYAGLRKKTVTIVP
ncbi:MAG TPA: hypothetical protein VGN16_21085 [Acidobacteriaceae bacterium]